MHASLGRGERQENRSVTLASGSVVIPRTRRGRGVREAALHGLPEPRPREAAHPVAQPAAWHLLAAPGSPQCHGAWNSEGPAQEERQCLGNCHFRG